MWKKSGVLGNKKFRLLLLLEVVLLVVGIVGLIPGNRVAADETTMDVGLSGGEYLEEKQGYYIDDSYGYYGIFLTARPGRLQPGVYTLRIVLEADAAIKDSEFGIVSESGKFRNMLSNPAAIYGGLREQTCQFYVNVRDDSGKITINYGGNSPLLIKKIEVIHTNAGSRILICLILAGAALVNTLFMLYRYGKRYPISIERKLVWIGIPALAAAASFPLFVDYMLGGEELSFYLMRIEALAQSILQGDIPFYCDTLLVLPALMRLAGFQIGIAYGTYVFAVNLATAAIAYVCFKGCFGDRRIGMFGSMLYTLAPYRIYIIYNRAAVGEYMAMTFLPLLVYGVYRIFTDDPKEKKYKYNWLFLALGFSGLIQSHMLSGQYRYSENYENGLLDTEPSGVGLALLLGAGAFLVARDIFKEDRDKKRDRAALVSLGIGVFALLISTSYFPWNFIRAGSKAAGVLVSMLEFPTRLMIVPTVCMTFTACAGAEVILKQREQFWKRAFFAVVCGAALVFSLYQTNDILMTKEGPVRIYSVENMGHSAIHGGE